MSTLGEQFRESRAAIAGVVRNPGLRRLNVALVGSVIGDWAYAVAASVYAYSQGGATAVGLIGVARYVLVAVVAPFASLLADRLDRRRVMIVVDLVRGALVLTAAAIIETDGPAIAVYVLAIVVALVGTPFRPSQAALLPQLAEHPDELTAANVASSTIESVGFFVGPALAGLLLAVTDPAAVYAFDALTFVWSAVVVLGLRLPEGVSAVPKRADDEPSDGFLRESMAGYREILRSRDLRLVIGLYCAQTLVAGASLVFVVAIALDLLDLGDGGVGLLEAALGVGGLLGGAVALVLSRRGRLAADFGVGVALWALPLLLIAAWPVLPTALLAMATIGLANSVVDINASTILQRLVPDAVMGRVFGAMDSAVIGGMALGAAVMPLLLHTIGLRPGLAVIGGLVTLLVLLGSAGLARIDRHTLGPAGLEVLRRVPMLAALPEPVLERLARGSEQVRVPAGEVVFREGQAGDRFYVIESGRVDVAIRDQFVRSQTAGESFGEIALLRDVPRTATITAASDTVLRSIDRDLFLPAVTGHGASSEQAEHVVTWRLGIV
ncbi:MAG: MFS transporter [Acidimicrobiales bacterium]